MRISLHLPCCQERDADPGCSGMFSFSCVQFQTVLVTKGPVVGSTSHARSCVRLTGLRVSLSLAHFLLGPARTRECWVGCGRGCERPLNPPPLRPGTNPLLSWPTPDPSRQDKLRSPRSLSPVFAKRCTFSFSYFFIMRGFISTQE